MREVTGAVIAISIVLIAVFVPVAFFPGHHRRHLPPVRADHRRLGPALHLLRADADAGAERACCCARSTTQVELLPQDRPRRSTALRDGYGRALGALLPPPAARAGRVPRLRRRHGAAVPRGAHRLHPRRGPGLPHHLRAGPRRACRWPRPRRCCARSRPILQAAARGDAPCSWSAASRSPATGPNIAQVFVNLKPWDERPGKEQSVAGAGRAPARPAAPHRRGARAAVSAAGHPRRRAPSAAFSSWSRTARAAARWTSSGHGRPGADRQGQPGSPGCAASSPPSPRTRRCSTSRSTARRPRRWACRSIRSSARCSSSWAAST